MRIPTHADKENGKRRAEQNQTERGRGRKKSDKESENPASPTIKTERPSPKKADRSGSHSLAPESAPKSAPKSASASTPALADTAAAAASPKPNPFSKSASAGPVPKPEPPQPKPLEGSKSRVGRKQFDVLAKAANEESKDVTPPGEEDAGNWWEGNLDGEPFAETEWDEEFQGEWWDREEASQAEADPGDGHPEGSGQLMLEEGEEEEEEELDGDMSEERGC